MTKKLWAMGLCDESGANSVAGEYIWVMLSGYDPNINAALKSELPGPPRWRSGPGVWVFPRHWDTCTGARKVADRFGAELKLSDALVSWATEEKARQALIPDVKSMDLVELPAVQALSGTPMWDMLSSRPFQTVGVAFAARNRSCLIADEPGLGKTLQTIGAIIESGVTGMILVVAPKAAAQITWPKQLAQLVPFDNVTVIDDTLPPAGRLAVLEGAKANVAVHGATRHWVVTSPYYVRIRAKTDQYGNYERDSKGKKIVSPVGSAMMELFDVSWAGLIVDESHQTLAGATGNKKKQSAQRLGLGALEVLPGGLRIALSGTPFRGKEHNLWGQLNWLRPDKYRSYRRWLEQHFHTYFNGFGWETGGVKDRAAMYAEAAEVMIRRTKAEVAKDLPPKDYGGWVLDSARPEGPTNPKAVWLDMDKKQAKAYEDMQKHAAAELDGGTLLTTGILAELTRLKQFAGSYGKLLDDGETFAPTLPSNKFDWTYEFLDERAIPAAGSSDVENRDLPKIVVASQFSQLINVFAAELEDRGLKVYRFTGETTPKRRKEIEDDWQNNPDSDYRVLLLTTTAGGVSLTLDAADDMVILDETWNPDDQKQVEDRIHRLSRVHNVTIWKVFSRNTIEESIASGNLASDVSLTTIMDVERAKALIHK